MQNPNWIFAGVFADDGRSATNTFRRDDFNQLMNQCLKGKVDMVITKSISRFARNTVDCISWVRKLREKNVAVYFEKENLNTLDDSTEMILTILSSQAQEESRAISTNVKWGYARKFEKGESTSCLLYTSLGGFGRIADYDNIRQAGFDYAELDVPEIEALAENEFRIFCDKVHEIGFPVLTGARALPVAKPWFFTDSFNALEYKAYLEHACHRAKLLGTVSYTHLDVYKRQDLSGP